MQGLTGNTGPIGPPGSLLISSQVDVSYTGAPAFTDLFSLVTPIAGNTFIQGNMLWIVASGAFNANANSKTIRFRIGKSPSGPFSDSDSVVTTGGYWIDEIWIIRLSSTSIGVQLTRKIFDVTGVIVNQKYLAPTVAVAVADPLTFKYQAAGVANADISGIFIQAYKFY